MMKLRSHSSRMRMAIPGNAVALTNTDSKAATDETRTKHGQDGKERLMCFLFYPCSIRVSSVAKLFGPAFAGDREPA
jgi:hypothetical protein